MDKNLRDMRPQYGNLLQDCSTLVGVTNSDLCNGVIVEGLQRQPVDASPLEQRRRILALSDVGVGQVA